MKAESSDITFFSYQVRVLTRNHITPITTGTGSDAGSYNIVIVITAQRGVSVSVTVTLR